MFIQQHNCETGEIIQRQLTDDEIAKRDAEYQADQEAKAIKMAARKAILDRLGLTEEEARLLLG